MQPAGLDGRVVFVAGDGSLVGAVTREVVRAGARAFVLAPDARAVGAIVAGLGHNAVDGAVGDAARAVAAARRRFGRLDLFLLVADVQDQPAAAALDRRRAELAVATGGAVIVAVVHAPAPRDVGRVPPPCVVLGDNSAACEALVPALAAVCIDSARASSFVDALRDLLSGAADTSVAVCVAPAS